MRIMKILEKKQITTAISLSVSISRRLKAIRWLTAWLNKLTTSDPNLGASSSAIVVWGHTLRMSDFKLKPACNREQKTFNEACIKQKQQQPLKPQKQQHGQAIKKY